MFYLVKDDNGTQIKATITREDTGNTVNLENATVRLKFRAVGSSTVLSTLTSTSSSVDAAEGIAVFVFTSSDLNVPAGSYEGEIEATFDNGNIETVYEKLEFYLRDDF